MGWNDSGNNDPWNNRNKQSGPPDLDQLLKQFQKKLAGMIGNQKSNGGSSPKDGDKMFNFVAVSAGLIFIAIWIFAGFFIVKAPEEAVELRFGKYTTTVGPGLHWIPRGIQSAYRVDVQQVDSYQYSAEMLTKDENIVKVDVAVQYRKEDPKAYLFNVEDPVESLRQATASALREVVGSNNLTDILTSGRTRIAQDVENQLKMLMENYKTGLSIIKVAMQPAKAPEAVQDAFDDAIKAREDEQRYINQAEAYRLQVLPQAEGQAKRLLADAKAYREQVVLNAKGEIARFDALLPQYRYAPEVMRQRLYLSALGRILNNSTKIFVDSKQGNNNLLYLPLDQLLKAQATNQTKVPYSIQSNEKGQSLTQSSNATERYDTSTSIYPSNSRTNYRGRGY